MRLWGGKVNFYDPSLDDSAMKSHPCNICILVPGHGDESKTLGALVVVDYLRILHVPELTKQHDQVVLSVAEGDVGDVKPLGDGLLVP